LITKKFEANHVTSKLKTDQAVISDKRSVKKIVLMPQKIP